MGECEGVQGDVTACGERGEGEREWGNVREYREM